VLSLRSSFRFTAAAVAALVLSGFSVAHLHLKASLPAADATVESSPKQIMLIFSGPPEAALSRLQLLGPDSALVAIEKPTSAPDSLALIATITGKMGPGRYTVKWRAAGRDGHPNSGEFAFTIAKAAAARSGPAAATSRDHTAQ
jgi:methionine-rich copper-binding protein CopC